MSAPYYWTAWQCGRGTELHPRSGVDKLGTKMYVVGSGPGEYATDEEAMAALRADQLGLTTAMDALLDTDWGPGAKKDDRVWSYALYDNVAGSGTFRGAGPFQWGPYTIAGPTYEQVSKKVHDIFAGLGFRELD